MRIRSAAVLVLVVVLTMAVSIATARAADLQDYHVYYGDLHTHLYSHGDAAPVFSVDEMFRYARDVGHMDFIGYSEHGFVLRQHPDAWRSAQASAQRYSQPGRFVVLVGAEWSDRVDGHINHFFGDEYGDRDRLPGYRSFYDWIESQDILVQFNHPSFEFQHNWDRFAYRAAADRKVQLLEVGSGHRRHNIRPEFEAAFRLALDKGWHVGATANSDDHGGGWGTSVTARTGVLAPELTRQSLRQALFQRRTFATEDGNAILGLFGNGQPMGSILHADRVELRIEGADADAGDGFQRVQVVTTTGRIGETVAVDGATAFSLTRSFPVTGDTWVYVRAVQTDGDILVTSPIWVERGISDQI